MREFAKVKPLLKICFANFPIYLSRKPSQADEDRLIFHIQPAFLIIVVLIKNLLAESYLKVFDTQAQLVPNCRFQEW
jgi:hypothetical protein